MRIIIVLALMLALLMSGCTFLGGGKYDDFAKCLDAKGVKMYGSKDCMHCAKQKESFGSSFQYVDYVECSVDGQPGAEAEACRDAGVMAYPTWIFPDKTLVEGEMSFGELSDKSGCALPSG